MSKIFEALRKGTGEIADTVLNAGGAAAVDVVDSLIISEPMTAMPAVLPAHVAEEPVERSHLNGAAPELHLRVRSFPLVVSESSPLLPFDSANLRAAEEYRMIRTRVLQDPRQPRMLLVSSANPQDGKSVTAINLAGALSLKTEAKVLLVDGDFRRSTIHTQLRLPQAPGLTDILLNRAELEDSVVQAEQFPNLYVLPVGTLCPSPGDLLETSAWESTRERIRELFRFIIVDCPPIGAVAEYDLLLAACDGVIVVARPDHTNLEAFLKALGTVPREKLIGVVINGVIEWFLTPAGGTYAYYGNAGKRVT